MVGIYKSTELLDHCCLVVIICPESMVSGAVGLHYQNSNQIIRLARRHALNIEIKTTLRSGDLGFSVYVDGFLPNSLRLKWRSDGD